MIGANAHADLRAAILHARPDLEVRGGVLGEITAEDLAWADVFVGFRRPRTPSMGRVRWVHCTGAGVDAWLYPVELPREILLTRSSESFGPMIAEWALARALAFRQQLLDLARAQREGRWAPRDLATLRGSTAVVIGTGDVGLHIGRLFSALGCRLLGVSRSGRGDPAVFERTVASDALADVAAEADWLIVTLPLTRETHRLVSREVLARCRGAVLINAGRGAVVEERAIPEALEAGWLSGAALDVFEVEPLPPESPLWRDERVMISPHISGLTTVEGAAAGFLECLADLERGVAPRWLVDRSKQY